MILWEWIRKCKHLGSCLDNFGAFKTDRPFFSEFVGLRNYRTEVLPVLAGWAMLDCQISVPSHPAHTSTCTGNRVSIQRFEPTYYQYERNSQQVDFYCFHRDYSILKPLSGHGWEWMN